MKAEILKILNNNSYKVDLLGTNEESIQAIDEERIIDTEDIEIITDELIKLFSLHLVSETCPKWERTKLYKNGRTKRN